jgi:hypothetical protein
MRAGEMTRLTGSAKRFHCSLGDRFAKQSNGNKSKKAQTVRCESLRLAMLSAGVYRSDSKKGKGVGHVFFITRERQSPERGIPESPCCSGCS